MGGRFPRADVHPMARRHQARNDHQSTSIYYADWQTRHVFVQVPIQGYVAQWLQSFKEFPPRQEPASFNLDEVMHKLQEGPKGNN